MNNLSTTIQQRYKRMKNIGLYLAGPILGCSDAEVHVWRDQVKGILCCYPGVKIYDPATRDYRKILAEAATYEEIEKIDDEIVTNDVQDILECQAVMAGCHKPSAGTSQEIWMAWHLPIFVVTIVPDRMQTSAWIRRHSSIVVESYVDAIDALRRVFPSAFEKLGKAR
jgi:hypothetical protein